MSSGPGAGDWKSYRGLGPPSARGHDFQQLEEGFQPQRARPDRIVKKCALKNQASGSTRALPRATPSPFGRLENQASTRSTIRQRVSGKGDSTGYSNRLGFGRNSASRSEGAGVANADLLRQTAGLEEAELGVALVNHPFGDVSRIVMLEDHAGRVGDLGDLDPGCQRASPGR